MTTLWGDKYPNKEVLRKEITCMLEAFVDVLLEEIPEYEIEGIYFKGSGQKEWDSPLDYVPEISDIDIHLLLAEDTLVEQYFGTTEQALTIQAQVEERYFSNVPEPIHFPRPQLVMLNPAIKDNDFVPSPPNTITVLHGKPYLSVEDAALNRLQRIDCQRLLDEEQFLSKYPLHVVDRPSKYLWQALRNLVWHISPIGSRVLSIMGKSYEEAWGINRTSIVEVLKESGEMELVRDYSQFYMSAWDYFLSGYADTNAGRSAIGAGIHALTKAIEIARKYKSGGNRSDGKREIRKTN